MPTAAENAVSEERTQVGNAITKLVEVLEDRRNYLTRLSVRPTWEETNALNAQIMQLDWLLKKISEHLGEWM